MPPRIDIKKFVAGFLLFASVISSAAFLLSLSPSSPSGKMIPGQTQAPQGAAFDLAPANAFIESLPPTRASALETIPGIFPTSSVASSDSLTEQLLVALGEGLNKANPQGITDANGLPGILPPNIDDIVTNIVASRTAAGRIPNWESEVSRQKITVLTKYTTADIDWYNEQVNVLLEKYFSNSALANMDPSTADDTAKKFAKVQADGARLLVPEPLAGFHWSLMKLLAYQERAVRLTTLADTDPIRASLIAKAQESNYLAAIQLLVNESQKMNSIHGISAAQTPLPRITALLNVILGVKTAHAIFGVGDISFDPAAFARTIWEWVQKVITEKLKDQLVHKLVTQTIGWIQGGGKPQFVTDWKGFLRDTVKDQVARDLTRIAPQLCSSFGPLIKIAVTPVDPSRDFMPACSLDQVVRNVEAFADSFENGGWIAYGAVLEPSNNFFGSLIQTNEIIQREAADAAEAAQNDAGASSGFLSSRECVKYTSEYQQCKDSLPPGSTLTCSPRMSQVENICVEWRNTTPGETLAGSVKDSFAAPLARIVNAQDMAALANALINAALSKLVKLGASTVSKGLLGLSMSTYETAPAADTCAGLTGSDLVDCQSEWEPVVCTPVTVTVPINVTIDVPPVCTTDPVTGIETCSGGGPTSGMGTVTNPNAAECTGGPLDGSAPPSGGSCNAENCGGDCLCKVRDGVTKDDFCFLNNIQTAIRAVEVDWRTRNPSGERDAATGLIGAPYGGCQGSFSRACVFDANAFKGAVVARLSGGAIVGDEVCVTGPSCKSTCSYGSPADCRVGLAHAQGTACTTPTRRECSKIEASNNTIMYNNANAICPM